MAIYLGDKQIAGSSINSLNNSSLCSISQSIVNYAFDVSETVESADIKLTDQLILRTTDDDGNVKLRNSTIENVFGLINSQPTSDNYNDSGTDIDRYDSDTYFYTREFDDLSESNKTSEEFEVELDDCTLNCHLSYTVYNVQGPASFTDYMAIQIQNENSDTWYDICRHIPHSNSETYQLDRHIAVGSGVKIRAHFHSQSGTKLSGGQFRITMAKQGQKITLAESNSKLNRIASGEWTSSWKRISVGGKGGWAIIESDGKFYKTDKYKSVKDYSHSGGGNVYIELSSASTSCYFPVEVKYVKNDKNTECSFTPFYVQSGDYLRVRSTCKCLNTDAKGSYKVNTVTIKKTIPSLQDEEDRKYLDVSEMGFGTESQPDPGILMLKFSVVKEDEKADTSIHSKNNAKNIIGFANIDSKTPMYVKIYDGDYHNKRVIKYLENGISKMYHTFRDAGNYGTGKYMMQISGDIEQIIISNRGTKSIGKLQETGYGLPAYNLVSIYSWGPANYNIGQGCFNGASRIKTINIPETCTLSDSTAVFAQCLNLTSVTIPNKTKLGSYMFYNCQDLSTINNLSSASCNTNLSNVFYNLPIENLDLRGVKKLKAIGQANATIGNCKNLSSIVLNHEKYSDFDISKYGISGCDKLTAVKIINCGTITSDIMKNWVNKLKDCKNLVDNKCYAWFYKDADYSKKPGSSNRMKIE